MIKADVVLGLQYGDEGKGKVCQFLLGLDSPSYSQVARFNGSENAGHAVYDIKGKKFAFHYLPVGILNRNVTCVLGHGMVINIENLKNEIKTLIAEHVSPNVPLSYYKQHILLSKDAFIITKEHLEQEIRDGMDKKIGTTKKGVGPAFADKIARKGKRIKNIYDIELHDLVTVCDTKHVLSIMRKKIDTCRILCEGAQAFGLDVDYGDYPYVTSSNCTTGAVINGLGIAHKEINNVIGVIKPYTTRVGPGWFPTEMTGEIQDMIREKAKEYGETTGRPRKIGWFDIDQVKQGIEINGITSLALTKLDVIESMDMYAYVDNANIPLKLPRIPSNIDDKTKRYYREMFVDVIESLLGVPVSIISYGTSPKDIELRKELL